MNITSAATSTGRPLGQLKAGEWFRREGERAFKCVGRNTGSELILTDYTIVDTEGEKYWESVEILDLEWKEN